MAFSKTPRVLITDELSRPGVPGPCDYDPNDASEKRVKGFSIREEEIKKERRQSLGRDPWTDWFVIRILILEMTGPWIHGSGKINYLTKKDTTHIQSKLARSSSVTIPRKQLKGLEKVCHILSWSKCQFITIDRLRPVTLQDIKVFINNHSRFCSVICARMRRTGLDFHGHGHCVVWIDIVQS